jgi:nucleotide-binding universal stress UspA family protein
MSTVLVITNLSASSQNAVDYTCSFLNNPETRVLLLRVFSFSSGYAGEGVALAALEEISQKDEQQLEAEYIRVREKFPQINLEVKMVAGIFSAQLEEQIAELNPGLIVMGAEGDYSNLISWDVQVLNAFIDLPVPVLVIPAHISFIPVMNIAFACNFKYHENEEAVRTLKKIVSFTNAQLHLIHVNSTPLPLTDADLNNKQIWKKSLEETGAIFYELSDRNITMAIDQFVKEKQVNLLMIVPHRAGIWQRIFSRSHTTELVNLNHVPVMALRRSSI